MNKVEHIADGVSVYLGDCREILPTLPVVDLVVTSPPYAQQRKYVSFVGGDGSLVGCLKDTPSHSGTQIFINLGMVHKDGEVIEYWNPIIRDMRGAMWRLFGWYVWDQGDGLPGDWAGRLAPSHEFIFHFNRNGIKPHKTKPAVSAGRKPSGSGLRKASGEITGWTGADHKTHKIPDSVIRVYREMSRSGPESEHPARFPVGLPGELISAFSNPGEVICDPFLGSGTTGVAAVNQGRRFMGIEIEQSYFDIACARISAALKQQDLFIDKPAPVERGAHA